MPCRTTFELTGVDLETKLWSLYQWWSIEKGPSGDTYLCPSFGVSSASLRDALILHTIRSTTIRCS